MQKRKNRRYSKIAKRAMQKQKIKTPLGRDTRHATSTPGKATSAPCKIKKKTSVTDVKN
jgi:hypothetical protein